MRDRENVPRVPDDAEETPEDYDPLLDQGERLPSFLRGTDGNLNDHVRPVTEEDLEASEEEPEDYKPRDPSTFTADS